jgi:ribosome modulation factor
MTSCKCVDSEIQRDDIDRYFIQGAVAYRYGVQLDDCPYYINPFQKNAWVKGWTHEEKKKNRNDVENIKRLIRS